MLFDELLNIPSPSHVINLDKIQDNLDILNCLRQKTNLTLLFAIKGFSNPQILHYYIEQFDGISASSLWEARFAKKLTSLPVHIFSPAFSLENFSAICSYSDYIIFNSPTQWKNFGENALSQNIQCGIRINPKYSEITNFAIDPCHRFSRFGISSAEIENMNLTKIDGIHFHTMCEQFSDTFLNTLSIIEQDFGTYLYKVKWLNIGGGQLFCSPEYNLQSAIEKINHIQNKYNLKIFAEPCETVVSGAGYFVATVTDIVYNGMNTAILDASAICHLPDIVHSPYRCEIFNATKPNTKKYTYRIAGSTCYAGDIFGDYSFDNPLDVGSKIIFLDTASYSMVKSNIFNGIQLPSYVSFKNNHIHKVEKKYGYEVFSSLL